jgi:hypothetical protein
VISLWLASTPLPVSALLVFVVPTGLAMLICAMIRRRVSLEKLSANNEVAGFKFAVLGVLYAVLLGFVVVVVWEKFHDAETAVERQAGAIATLFRLSQGLSQNQGGALRHDLEIYVRTTIDKEWPAMAAGESSAESTEALNKVYAAVLSTSPNGVHAEALISGMLTELDSLSEARRTSISLGEGAVPDVLWSALLFGAGATIGFTFFFGTNSARAQVIMTGLLTFVVFVMLWVVVVINHPFTGPVSVSSSPLKNLLRDLL